MAFVLSPEPPLSDWIAELDAQIARSATFFAGRPIAPRRRDALPEPPPDDVPPANPDDYGADDFDD